MELRIYSPPYPQIQTSLLNKLNKTPLRRVNFLDYSIFRKTSNRDSRASDNFLRSFFPDQDRSTISLKISVPPAEPKSWKLYEGPRLNSLALGGSSGALESLVNGEKRPREGCFLVANLIP